MNKDVRTIARLRAGNPEAGYTILELILVIVLIGIIAGVMARMFLWGVDIFDFISDRKDLFQSSRIGMEILVKDLHAINSTANITSASSSQLNFTNLNNQQVAFSYNNGVLSRNSNNLIVGLDSFHFTFYDVNGDTLQTPVSTPSTIWKIKFSLNATVDNKPIHLQSIVVPRRFQ